jgi:hypothetical protein
VQAGGAGTSPSRGEGQSPVAFEDRGTTRVTKRIAVVLLTLATLLWTVAGLAIWSNRQMLDTKNWVQTSDALPPQLRGLAAPTAAAVRQAASQRLPEILGSDAALAEWEKANEGAHKVLLTEELAHDVSGVPG